MTTNRLHRGTVNRYLDTLANVAILFVAGMVLWRTLVPSSAKPGVRSASLPKNPISLSDAPVEGDNAAGAALVVYSDFQCPFCGKLARETLSVVRSRYVKTGRLRLAFKHMPLGMHANAKSAAEMSVCAKEQNRFWQLHDRFFEHQPDLANAQSIQRLAAEAGVDLSGTKTCLASAAKVVEHDSLEANILQITGTPALFLGSVQGDGSVRVSQRFSGAVSTETLLPALDELLRK